MNEALFTSLNKSCSNANATLVVVSKTRTLAQIEAYYNLGVRDFGENRVEELLQKQTALPDDIKWHAIGHLQRNKVKKVVPFVHLIHSVDSERLLEEINKCAKAIDRKIGILLQFHIAQEESKYGLASNVANNLFERKAPATFSHIDFKGVMGMATFSSDKELVRNEFKQLHSIFKEMKNNWFSNNEHFSEISMGMSGDFEIALEEGSTMLRIGSSLFPNEL